MATKSKSPIGINKSNSGINPMNPKMKFGKKMTPKQMEHEVKLSLMRDCKLYGKSVEATIAYFTSKGYNLGHTQYTDLTKELKSARMAIQWFDKEALYVIEQDHMLSTERIRMMENRLLEEFEQVAATNFYKYINEGKDEQEIIRNKSHDANLLLRIITSFESLQLTKTKMFSAAPLVQEMMEVHRMHEDEAQIITKPDKTIEKEITEK